MHLSSFRLLLFASVVTFSTSCLPQQHSLLSNATLQAAGPDWSANTAVPDGGRANVYQLSDGELAAARTAGLRYALNYPVTSTKLLLPYQIFRSTIESGGAMKMALNQAGPFFANIRTIDDFYGWLGLYPFPRTGGEIPFPGGKVPDFRMGASFIARGSATGLTFGCASCHFGQLFGRPVPGLTTRFPRANAFFQFGSTVIGLVQAWSFRLATGASADEVAMVMQDKDSFRAIGIHKPAALGLDTSVSQVGLSLARRRGDAYATIPATVTPPPSILDTLVVDSKPSVWWNVKYKNRWLSDGSAISGNPILTNILWNEIGRGADLKELEAWIDGNDETIKQLTAAVFATKAPKYTDFFPASTLDLDAAKAGQKIFNKVCSPCHGTYKKAWEQAGADSWSPEDQLATVQVNYPKRTFVVDVGTDPGRHLGMAALAAPLNGLAISKNKGLSFEQQVGYVPPPLVGIWARWPYFHNNSAPSLCAVLTAGAKRPTSFFTGEPIDPNKDFDRHCNGYPLGDAAPAAWRGDAAHLYDTSRPGLSNRGHDEGIFLRNGVEILSGDDKTDLVEYLKTL